MKIGTIALHGNGKRQKKWPAGLWPLFEQKYIALGITKIKEYGI
jgi:hypothetical protein